jgi:pyruvate/2-oxoglutarate dehydrogenase complex dihydrolipoamide dehydrogenase (E3) component
MFRPLKQQSHQLFYISKVLHRSIPSGFKNKAYSTMKQYDAIVIGSGQAGTPLAAALTKSGKKTAMIESTHIGGCCVNEGCTPTKTMITSGRIAYLSRRAAKDYGVHVGGEDAEVKVDMLRVRQRKRDIVTSFRSGGERRLKDANVDVLMGTAEFTAEKELKVRLNDGGELQCKSDLIILNIGERPAVPKLNGLEEALSKEPGRFLDSTSIQELGEVPESLIVLGGGYVGLEFGQLFQRLGSKVTVVQRAARLMPREDPDITKCLQEILEDEGLRVLLSTAAVSISATDSQITLVVDSNGSKTEVKGSHILLATGRRPNTDVIQLAKSGVKMDQRGYVLTNETLETNIPGIYVLGDAKGPPAFTHVSYDDFRILRDNLNLLPAPSASSFDKPPKPHTLTARKNIIPYTAYTDPQLGHVGLHLHEIPESERKNIKIAIMPMAYVARALETDETRGMMKAVVNGETGQILGFTCLGIEGGEVISAVQMAMMGGLKWWDLREAVWAHPTIMESLNNIWGFLEDA